MSTLDQYGIETILHAATDLFYEKDFKSVKMVDIIARAGIPHVHVYLRFKSTDEIFNAIVKPLVDYVNKHLVETDLDAAKHDEATLLKLFDWRKEIVLILDRSAGSQYEGTRDKIVKRLGKYLFKNNKIRYPGYNEAHATIMAVCTVESVLVLARQYKDQEWLKQMIKFLTDFLVLNSL